MNRSKNLENFNIAGPNKGVFGWTYKMGVAVVFQTFSITPQEKNNNYSRYMFNFGLGN